ncbi:hypothetical protein Tco_0117762 [Tanacetum coccineum]
MSDSEDSTVTYTEISSPYEDLSDIGSPGAEGPIFQDPSSPDYVPGLRSRAGNTFTYLCTLVPEPVTGGSSQRTMVLPAVEQHCCCCLTYTSHGIIRVMRSEHLAPADPVAVAYSADQDPYLAYRVTARMSIRPQAPAPFLFEEVAERLLALPTPPPSPLSHTLFTTSSKLHSPPLPYHHHHPIALSRDALPSPVHETEMPEICLPLRKRPCRTTPGPGYEVGESSAAGAARQVGPTTARADLYGFADMLDAAPGRQTSRELGYGITDTWDDLVGAIQEIAPTTLEGVSESYELATNVDSGGMIYIFSVDGCLLSGTILRAYTSDSSGSAVEIAELQAAVHRRQTVISDLLKADHRRQRQLVEALKIVKSLSSDDRGFRDSRDPVKDPTDPRSYQEEASRSS